MLGLAGEHAYAIVDMKEEDGRRLFLIKNPWSEGQVWAGSLGKSDNDSGISDPTEAKLMPGTFWMDLNNIFQHFDVMYLNWNPGLFSYRQDAHLTWDLTSKSSPASFNKNPQYIIRSDRGGTVWVVLSMHFRTIDTGPHAQPDQYLNKGYLSLYAFEGQYRVPLTDGSICKSPYVDAPNILLRLDLQAKTPYVIVVSEQGMPCSPTNFTLSVFSLHLLSSFSPAEEKYSYYVSERGTWTPETAGGNATSIKYKTNPHFRFTIHKASDLSILLEAEDKELAVHTKLLWASGKRVSSQITTKDVFGDSGEYRRGCAWAEINDVLAGTYTIVCSTFQEGQLGEFSLLVRSSTEGCTLKAVPSEEAGMAVVDNIRRARLSKDTDRVLAPIKAARSTRLWIHAQSIVSSASGAAAHSPLTISIEFGQGPNKRILGSTGEFRYAASGLRTSDVDITPRMCAEGGPGVWMVVERVGGSCVAYDEEVEVKIYCSDTHVQVGEWGKEADETVEELKAKLAKPSLSHP